MTLAGRLLQELGVSDTKIGFKIIEQLIGVVVEDPSLEQGIFGEAAAQAAERANASYESVSRNTRYALRAATQRKDFERRIERVATKYDIPDLEDIMTMSGAISVKKLVLKAAHALGDDWSKEV